MHSRSITSLQLGNIFQLLASARFRCKINLPILVGEGCTVLVAVVVVHGRVTVTSEHSVEELISDVNKVGLGALLTVKQDTKITSL